MRVLFVIGTMGRGGAEIQVKEMALALVARGHTVGVVVLLPFLDFEGDLRAGGVETLSLGMARGVPTAKAVVGLATFARRFRPDVVHAHMYAAIILARAVRALPTPFRGRWRALVCTSHSGVERSRARYLAYRLTAGLSDQWTSVSRDGLEGYRRNGALGRQPAMQVPNGVDTDRFHPDPRAREEARAALGVTDAFLWLAVGSFNNEDKDQATLLRAFAARVAAGATSTLILVGNGVLLEGKQALARELGLEGRAQFLGMRADVPRLLQAADAYVLSSQQEALPIAVLEAAATELPIVTTDVGDCAAIVKDGVYGFVVPRRDPGALAAAMASLEAMTGGVRQRMGRSARDFVLQNFSLEAIVTRWEHLYAQLVGIPATAVERSVRSGARG